MLKIDDLAPAFCKPNQDGVEICLRDLKGRWIVLYFYPKDNTSGCTTEACEFTQAEPDFDELDAVILGVSPDSCKKHRDFIAKNELGITLLSDETKELCKSYGILQTKKCFGKEYEGVIRSTFIINPQGNISAIWNKVKVKGHIDEVKSKLEELVNI